MIDYRSFDIETVPRPDFPDECLPQFDPDSVALGNLKDPVKIEEKIETARRIFERDRDKKASLDPDRCMVCCFCGYDKASDSYLELFAKDIEEERELLIDAWDWFLGARIHKKTIVSHNGRFFDLPVLYRRAMIQDVSASPQYFQRIAGRYAGQDEFHQDVMLVMRIESAFGAKDYRSLDYYARLFGLEGKIEGWDGSKVYPAFQSGWFEDIQLYCKNDVVTVSQVFERALPWLMEPLTQGLKAA